MLLPLLLNNLLSEAGTPVVETPAVQTGGSARRRRRPHLVEINGEFFEVADEQEAIELLDRASALISQRAEMDALRNIKRAKRGKQAVIEIPVISTDAPELQSLVSSYREDIEAIYRKMAMEAEIRELMRIKMLRDEDEEDALAVLLLN